MRRSLARVAVTATLTLGFTALAEEAESAQLETLNLPGASAGCYVDTPAFDVATPDSCFATLNRSSTVAIFSVLGLDQSSGRYSIQYLNNTCETVSYTTSEGWVCKRTIYPYSDITQWVQVTDTQTGASATFSATARYEYNW